ncbi:MAG: hypothetical protein HUK21_00125 [Fibrobacteraceae bacterium]|nr:hypothetical protein [Fibrobacteraceae bacterium]
MKKIIILLSILVVASFAKERPDYIHSAFFFQPILGISAVDYTYKEEYGGHYEKSNFEGWGVDVGMKIGAIIRSLVAPYATFSFANLSGDARFKYLEAEVNEKYSDEVYRFLFGGGVAFFPFRNPEHILNGGYIALSIGIVIQTEGDGKDIEGYRYSCDGASLADAGTQYKLELGKVWNIGDLWHAGVIVSYAIDEMVSSEVDSHSLGFAITVLRK